jgi:aspartyl-tRNA(Asn)/glutamyl-tRNA(Gln) amidotransferase subunit A
MLNELTISALTAKLAKREVSSRAATQACLDRVQAVDGQIRAFLSYDADDALDQADAADQAIAAGVTHSERPLLGVPIAIKDVIAVKGQPLSCGSKILGSYVSPYESTVIEKLRAAGAVIFGRLNMDEFAMGSSTEIPLSNRPGIHGTQAASPAALPAGRLRRLRPTNVSPPLARTRVGRFASRPPCAVVLV